MATPNRSRAARIATILAGGAAAMTLAAGSATAAVTNLHIERVALASGAITIDLTYSCDLASGAQPIHFIVTGLGNGSKGEKYGHFENGMAEFPANCDGPSHRITVNVPSSSGPFRAKSYVQVVASRFVASGDEVKLVSDFKTVRL